MSIPIIKVYAWWGRSVWQYSYVDPCRYCRKRHMHGGGDSEFGPDLDVGEVGDWLSHCIKRPGPVRLRLVSVRSSR